MNEDLKDCPFCGGKSQVISEGYMAWLAFCRACSTRSGTYMNEEIATNAWNARAEVKCVHQMAKEFLATFE